MQIKIPTYLYKFYNFFAENQVLFVQKNNQPNHRQNSKDAQTCNKLFKIRNSLLLV